MKAANITFARIAEFAWADMEPAEGVFTLDWIETAITIAAEAGISIVLGTPTAAPPIWMSRDFPETVATMENGRVTQHGGRCHYDPTSPRYLNFAARIAERMAQRWGQDPRVIGWQIDNEYTTTSYSAAAQAEFQRWLRAEYEDIDALNQAWSTSYWSQKYMDWDQVPLPAANSAGEGQAHNPGLRHAFRKFISHSYVRFQQNQLDVIRKHAAAHQFITHNFVMMRSHDVYKIASQLDFACWDYYFPNERPSWDSAGFELDLARGWKQKPFWVMETQPGSVNWASVNFAHRRGETRALAWNVIAHGGDGIAYWQWRMALNGQEQYHGSLLHQDGTPRPIYHEIAQFGAELAKAADAVQGEPKNQCALLYSYDDRNMIEFQRHHKDFDYEVFVKAHYKALAAQNIGLDVLSTRASLRNSGHKLVVAQAHMMDAEIARELSDFALAGGTLVILPRAGMKDVHNALHPERQPAMLQDAAGATVEEYFALFTPVPVSGEGAWAKLFPAVGAGKARAVAHTWAEWLKPAAGSSVLLRYGKGDGWLDGQPAATVHSHGKGRVYTLGAWLDDEALQLAMTAIAHEAGVLPVLANLPAGVHACQRGDATIILSGPQAATIHLPYRALDVLSERRARVFKLLPFDVLVLRKA